MNGTLSKSYQTELKKTFIFSIRITQHSSVFLNSIIMTVTNIIESIDRVHKVSKMTPTRSPLF